MTVNTGLMTADEFWRLPDDHHRHELVRGRLRTLPLRTLEHGHLTSVISSSLGRYVRGRKLGKALVGVASHLTSRPDTVRAPTLSFVRRERLAHLPSRDMWLPGAPDLASEITDQHDSASEVDEKVAEWLAHGTQLVFVVNPRRQTVAVHRPGQPIHILTVDDEMTGEDVVPGWSLSVRELFEQE